VYSRVVYLTRCRGSAIGLARWVGSAILLLAVVVACDSARDGVKPLATATTIGQMEWLQDGWLYYVVEGDSARAPELWRAAEGARPEKLDLPANDSCDTLSAISSLFLVGDRLGVAISCVGDDSVRLMAVDPNDTSRADLLATVPVRIENVAWLDSDSHGYADIALRNCRILVEIGIGRVVELKPELSDDIVTLSEGRAIQGHGLVSEDDCRGQENLGWPTYSSGRGLLFGMSSGAVNLSGVPRRQTSHALYLQEGDAWAQMVADELGYIFDTAISEDGSFAVVTTERADGGITLINLDSHDATVIVRGQYFNMALSPDGQKLAVVHYPDSRPTFQEIRIVDLQSYRPR
jgi:hypothetical protein